MNQLNCVGGVLLFGDGQAMSALGTGAKFRMPHQRASDGLRDAAALHAAGDHLGARRAAVVAVAGTIGGTAFAATPTTVDGWITELDLGTMIDTMLEFMSKTLATTGPKLIIGLGIMGAFYFVWNRLRSLF